MKILLILFFISMLSSPSNANLRCKEISNHLLASECFKSKKNIKSALEALSKFKESSDEEIYDYLDFKRIQILQNTNKFIESIEEFSILHPKSQLLKKIDFMHIEFLSKNNFNRKLLEKLDLIEKKYKLTKKDKLQIKFYRGLYFYQIKEYDKSFNLIKQISTRNPLYKSKYINELIRTLNSKHSYILSKKDKINRLNALYNSGQYTTFMDEYEENLSLQLLIKKSLIEIKSKKTEKGLMTLRNISQGKFASSGSQSKDLEAMAESKYRIILYELNKSKDNSALAIRLNSILTNFPNYKKNTEVGYLAARLFTIDKNYNQGIKVYNWLIKTKSRGYIDKSFYGLGFSEYMQGNYRDAIGYFRSLKESDKLYYQQLGSYWTAKCFLKLNDRDLAFKEFNELADIHKIGYYPYLASKEINKKIDIKPSKKIINSNIYKNDINLLVISKNHRKLRKEIENYIRNKINSTNFIDYLNELNYAGEFNLSIKISYSYNANDRYKYPRGFRSIVEKNSKKYGVDPNLIYALIREESLYDSKALSWVGAKGLMQIMDKTGDSLDRELKIKSLLFNPEDNINLGTYYLMKLSKRFNNNLSNILAAYNGGPNNVDLWRDKFTELDDDEFVENIPFKETNGYVKRVLRSYYYYKNNN